MSSIHLKSKTGFTLLEIMIALFIMGMVVTIVFGAYASTFRVIEGTLDQADAYQMARITLSRIQEDLECSMISKDPDVSFGFVGNNEQMDGREADTLSFLSSKHLVLDDDDHYAGNTRISFYVMNNEEEAEGLILYRSDTPTTESPPDEKTGGLILCEKLHALSLAYYDADSEELETWDSLDGEQKDKLPAMVTIRLEFLDQINPEEPIIFMTAVAIPMAKTEYGK